MRITDDLKRSVQDDWDAATDHPFCRDLAAGTLPLDKMRWYLVQDYKFIDQFVRLLATAIAHAPTLKDGIPAAQFLGLVTSTENTYFVRSFEALGVSQAQIDGPAAPETIAFQDLMAEARHSGRYEQMLAVLVVAEWSYLTWATRQADYDRALPFYFAEWIDLHTGDGFAGVVAYLRGQLDGIWGDLSEAEQLAAADLFKRAVRCERAFFDAAYGSTWDAP
ncbi:aminopyrimidine aminohydrolase [Jannaschia pagri]|uniref:Aminopyrimidine aminohydrolase n=1 Tax=Jannaschia pagri TaxID=2829797 RepID=A0ABQ4NHU5_9RHOB|nr:MULTISPECIES: TenA family protein [unclassified Jannaschia]GIT89900.1 aminopyrimidine aminohydrolase [Jannaschia sp. AI_61]GIT93993.1 aminopyrimidine aminohydrolase [Jannaschia sp. AI_62]